MIREDLELVNIEHLDFRPACEGTLHRDGAHGHTPDAPAAYLQIAPCGSELFKCASNVAYLSRFERISCSGGHSGCGGVHTFDEHLYLPL